MPPRFDFRITPQLTSVVASEALDLSDDAVVQRTEFGTVGGGAGAVADLAEIEECRFRGTSLSGAVLRKVTISDVEFDACDLAVLAAEDSSWTRVAIADSRVSGLQVTGATLQYVGLDRSQATDSLWRFAKLKRVRFVECNLTGADFTGCNFEEVELIRCDLTGVSFSQARVKGLRLAECSFARVTGLTALRGATIVLADPLDGLDLLGPMASDLGIRLE